MDRIGIKYKQGNASLESLLEIGMAINKLYGFSEGIDDFAATLRTTSLAEGVPPYEEQVRREDCILVRFVESAEHPKSLVLDEHLRNPDGTIYEGKSHLGHRCASSVGAEGSRIIEKYARNNAEVLRERFAEQLGPISQEDYGLYESLLFEFFLKNLPLLSRPNPPFSDISNQTFK